MPKVKAERPIHADRHRHRPEHTACTGERKKQRCHSRAVAMSRDEMFKRNKGAKKDRLKRRKTEVETRVKKLFKE